MVLPDGKKPTLAPSGGTTTTSTDQSADDEEDVSKSNKTDTENVTAAHKRAADLMFGDRSPVKFEAQDATPERPADGMTIIYFIFIINLYFLNKNV